MVKSTRCLRKDENLARVGDWRLGGSGDNETASGQAMGHGHPISIPSHLGSLINIAIRQSGQLLSSPLSAQTGVASTLVLVVRPRPRPAVPRRWVGAAPCSHFWLVLVASFTSLHGGGGGGGGVDSHRVEGDRHHTLQCDRESFLGGIIAKRASKVCKTRAQHDRFRPIFPSRGIRADLYTRGRFFSYHEV